MKKVFLGALFAVLLSTPALAQEIAVSGAYAFATAATAQNGAVFMEIMNETGSEGRLTGAASDVAERTELHTMSMDGGIMQMREVDSYTLPPGAYTRLEPMGKHIMLMGLYGPLKAGENFPLTLSFENHDDVTVNVTVVPPGQKPGKAENAHEESPDP